jgi:hypothetical protein
MTCMTEYAFPYIDVLRYHRCKMRESFERKLSLELELHVARMLEFLKTKF